MTNTVIAGTSSHPFQDIQTKRDLKQREPSYDNIPSTTRQTATLNLENIFTLSVTNELCI